MRIRTLHYENIFITSAKIPFLAGRTIAEIANAQGVTPEQALLEIIRVNGGRALILGRTVSPENTVLEIRDENAFISSDGFGLNQDALREGNLTHPRSFGAFPHFWHRFVIDTPILPPEQAIMKMTSGPAAKLRIPGRGWLRKGARADVVIFDPRLFRDRASHRNPFRYAAGMEWVLVNGRVSVEQGMCTGERAGQVVRRAN